MKDKLSYFHARALFNGFGISYLFILNGSSFLISGILGTLLGLIILILIKNTNNNKIIRSLIGFTLATISGIILVNMGHTLYLRETPTIILAMVPVLSALIISTNKKEPLKKVVFILFVYSMLLFFLKMAGLYADINIDNLKPMYPINIQKSIIGTITFTLIGLVPTLGLNDLSNKKDLIVNYLVSMVTIITVGFLAVSVLGIKEVQLYRYPEYIVLKRIAFLDFVNNVDSIFNFVIIVDLLFTMVSGLRNVNIFGKYDKAIASILMFVIIVWCCYYYTPILILFKYLPYILLLLMIILLIPKK